MKQIIVLGGGYGGILTAKRLGKKLKKQRDVQITLIDRSPFHTLLTELHEVAAGRVEEDSIRVDLKKIFDGFKNVNVVLDDISHIDFDSNTLQGEGKTYRYDYLVIGTGSKPTFFGIPGAEEHAFTLWSYEDAVNLREHILNMFRGAVKERNPEKRKQMLTFVVVGAGFTGVEMIGELAEYVNDLCREFRVDRSDVTLHVADMVDKILPILPEKLIRKAEKHLRKLKVNIITGTKITGVKPDGVILGDQEISSKTVIWTAGVEGSDLAGNAEVEQKGRKRLLTNDKLQVPSHPNVYVVGDNIFYIPEGAAAPVPQMVENAENSAPLAANNIIADLQNKPKESYKPKFHGMMVSIGSRYGVASVGASPKSMFNLTGFFAMFCKHFINMWYLFQICGFNRVYTYLLHEIFHVNHKRSFLGGHFSKRSPNFWLFPLRLFVGGSWLVEGIDKLRKVIDDPNKIFLIPAKVADGTSGASEAVSGLDTNTILKSINDIIANGDPAETGSTVSSITSTLDKAGAIPAAAPTPLHVPHWIERIVSWFMDLFFYTGDGGYTGLAHVFQTGMVCAEILFGVLLILGLFSAPAAIITVLMGIMIWSSGMASHDMLWYMFSGVALIGGSGSILGLDYYVYPVLKKAWRKIPFIKRFYLYAD
ncbi:NAD(P)/FAD-dependent oxidoreductase [Gorillibacterium massiliense]|uniref:NAD(P)/FAD-dependent oxidoreductase n=1 Tax=Gorillibacterium massiliense TaxID=1280390 RepID=UPI0004B5C2C4|nr:NAD(P)/FAD-dependent oxidoreductase [Gorillibacterium massiliense]